MVTPGFVHSDEGTVGKTHDCLHITKDIHLRAGTDPTSTHTHTHTPFGQDRSSQVALKQSLVAGGAAVY